VAVQFESAQFIPKMGWLTGRLALQRRLRDLVKRDGLDIVEAHDWCGLSAGIRPHCPLVIRCHGSALFFGSVLSEPVRPSVRLAETMAFRTATAIGSVSRFAATETARLFHVARPIIVLPNGVDCSQFTPAAPGEVDPRTILYTGTIVRKKGVLDLCRAFNRVVDAMPTARLVVIGRDTADKATGTSSTWALCLAELSPAARANVEYIGPQPYDTMQTFMRRAAVCAFPSHAEALPLAWLEAMACAKPIVAYDIGWAPEVVEPERTGLLAPHGNVEALAAAIVRILRDPSTGAAFGARARETAEARFAAPVAAERSIDWYRQVIAAQ
jgi:glycosyltransferase involved in cell wall biosynthesis